MRGLAGKVVVVVGGGTAASGPGNGAATAIRVAEEGARVAVGDVSAEAADATVAIVAARGGDAFAMESDVASAESMQGLVDAAVERYGRVDGLHVNAADMSADALGADGEHDLLTLPLPVWQRTIDVNLTGFVHAARAAIPALLAGGGGAIVNTVSDAVYEGEPVRVAYATTKTALTAVTRHIASRWGPEGIRCNSISPGIIVRNDELAEVMRSRHGSERRARRFGRPDDIAATSAFLLSDDGAFVNGQVWSVNGGRTLRA
jgi:NAD(P)-dependent dehydrogenase (short-subunit alcohol dehydrogenase family)